MGDVTNKSISAVIGGMVSGKQVASVHCRHDTLRQYRKHVAAMLDRLAVKFTSNKAGDVFKHESGGSIKFVVMGQALTGHKFNIMVYDEHPMTQHMQAWLNQSHTRLAPKGKRLNRRMSCMDCKKPLDACRCYGDPIEEEHRADASIAEYERSVFLPSEIPPEPDTIRETTMTNGIELSEDKYGVHIEVEPGQVYEIQKVCLGDDQLYAIVKHELIKLKEIIASQLTESAANGGFYVHDPVEDARILQSHLDAATLISEAWYGVKDGDS